MFQLCDGTQKNNTDRGCFGLYIKETHLNSDILMCFKKYGCKKCASSVKMADEFPPGYLKKKKSVCIACFYHTSYLFILL